MSSETKKSHIKEGFIAALKFIVPNVTLVIVVCLYALMGGFVFKHLESTNEQSECMERMNSYDILENKTFHDILSIMTSYRSPGDSNLAIAAFRRHLSTFRDNLLEIAYDGTNCSLLGTVNGTSYKWSLPDSILFSTTIFTTVGYGNIAPKTNWGRMVCIAYAILGIPLMLLTLANIGEIMANIFRYAYLSICCCGILKWRVKLNSLKKDKMKQIHETEIVDDVYEDLDKISVPIIVTLFLIGSYIFLGAVLFGEWLKLNWMDAAYFSFVTFSTIGFGDIVPEMDNINSTKAQLKMIGTALYMVMGMAILSMAFNLVQEEVIDKINWLKSNINNREVKHMKEQ